MIICLDTTVLISAIRGRDDTIKDKKCSPSDRTKLRLQCECSNGLLVEADKRKDIVIIPAPVVSEYLLGSPKFEDERDILLSRFIIPPLDASSAVIASQLEKSYRETLMKSDSDHQQVGRQSLRIDTMIAAIAISNNADVIYTHDVDHFLRVSNKKVRVSEVPNYEEQLNLLESTPKKKRK